MVVEVTKIVDNTMGEDNTKEVNKTKVVNNNYYGRQHQVEGTSRYIIEVKSSLNLAMGHGIAQQDVHE